LVLSLIAMWLIGTISCDNSDQRLAEYARHSVQQQAQQNEHIARQSESVAKQSQELAEAAHRMVEADAKSRHELVQAQRELNSELQVERAAIGEHLQDLEQERRRIAETRHRDPIIAAVIQATALTLACLLPLLVCAYALRQLTRSQPQDDGLSDLLVQELAAEESPLLPQWPQRRPAIEHHQSASDPTSESDASQKGDVV
jgi:hypothetical protein